MSSNSRQLHWAQRIALVRHNLHAASRSGDFHFFKTLQAAGFTEGTNHVATLNEELGDDADILLAAMDNLNAGLAYQHQDAFEAIYNSLRNKVRDGDQLTDKSKLYVDITIQKNFADMAIDKTASSAIALINQQPLSAQEAAANFWITGVTVVADCIEVSLKQMDDIETKMDDFIRLEASWNTVKASVVCAVTVLKGVFRLMDPGNPNEAQKPPRSSSIVSASGSMLRRLSSALAGSTTSSRSHSRSSSVVSASNIAPPAASFQGHGGAVSSSTSPVYRTPNYVRGSAAGCPTRADEFPHRKLSTIPPTPGAGFDDEQDPFDTGLFMPPEEVEMPAMPVPELNIEDVRVGQAC